MSRFVQRLNLYWFFWAFVAEGCHLSVRLTMQLQQYAIDRMGEHMSLRYGSDYDS